MAHTEEPVNIACVRSRVGRTCALAEQTVPHRFSTVRRIVLIIATDQVGGPGLSASAYTLAFRVVCHFDCKDVHTEQSPNKEPKERSHCRLGSQQETRLVFDQGDPHPGFGDIAVSVGEGSESVRPWRDERTSAFEQQADYSC